MSNNDIPANERVTGDVVAVMGNNRVDGYVSHDVVTVSADLVPDLPDSTRSMLEKSGLQSPSPALRSFARSSNS